MQGKKQKIRMFLNENSVARMCQCIVLLKDKIIICNVFRSY